MKPNVSIFDTLIRIFLGAAIGGIFGAMDNPIGILAIYPIITGLSAWDPVYQARKWYTTESSPYAAPETPKAKATAPIEKPYQMTA
jgi:hypothetical protein